MLEFLRGVRGVHLTEEEYDKDFDERWAQAPAFDRWKLERRQHFVEPWSESWQAFARGDWDEVLRIDAASAAGVMEDYRKAAERGIRRLRVRIVELPLTPYLHWELHAFRKRVAAGEHIRVVGPETVAPFEADGPVPELVNVGDTLYETVYDAEGLGVAGVRFAGAEVVTAYSAFMQHLFDQGEDFTTFYDREVAPLPPPCGVDA